MKNHAIVASLLFSQKTSPQLHKAFEFLCQEKDDPVSAETAFKKALGPEILGKIKPLEIATVIKACVAAYPEHADRLCHLIEPAIQPARKENMYEDREVFEGCVLGFLEMVVWMQENFEMNGKAPHEKFQKVFPNYLITLMFYDRSNWDCRDKNMLGRISNAIAAICKGFDWSPQIRRGQIVALVRAINKKMDCTNAFRSTLLQSMCRNFAYGLFGRSFVQDQIAILVEWFEDHRGFEKALIPEERLALIK